MKKASLLFISVILLSCSGQSQLFGKKKKNTVKTEKKKDKSKKIKDIVKSCKKHDGLFPIYQDTITGETYIEINKEQLNKEFIYFSYVENGIVEAGLFRGSYRSSRIFEVSKSFNRIEFSFPNTSFYFDTNNAISKSAEANINKSLFVSEKIEAKNDNAYLIKAKSLFLDENIARIKPNYPSSYKGFKLGSLSKDKSKVESIRNYPKNTDVRTQYVYENKGKGSRGSSATTDGRFITITYHHSILEVPQNDFKPRFDDPRVGYFMTQINDMTSESPTPYRDMIHRWNLVKKNPEQAISEPIEPITWWIENTTPLELRPIIKEGIETWNQAFEKAGFKNAVVVNIQPDDADWDAGDIRYNVLRWTSSPTPPFGGYGPSFVNPRTGQILGADIMLEYVYILGRMRQEEYFDIAGEQQIFAENDPHFCSAGAHMQHEVLFAKNAMKMADLTGIEKNAFLSQSLKRLVLHEVGHTLGLNHNMKGSSIQSLENIKNKKIIDEIGLCNSVMEYPSINFALDKTTQTKYYDDKPGVYDHWVIEFGYSTALENEDEEQKRLNNILARSTEPLLAFGNDADDMRSAGKGIDPAVNIYDLSSDPVGYGVERIKLIENKLIPSILTKFSKENQSYAELTNAYVTLFREKSIQLRVMTRQIGGVHVNRAYEGQKTDADPYTPVSYEKQKAALNALSKYAFAPDAFKQDEELLRHLQRQRRGFNFFSSAEDPKVYDRINNVHTDLLNHLLHKNVLNRIVNSSAYGNTYKISEYLNDLTKAIFEQDKTTGVNEMRQHLQIAYLKKLIAYIGKSGVLASTQSNVLYQIKEIEKMANTTSQDAATQAHRLHLSLLIEHALKK